MSELQYRLWKNMISEIDNYLKGEIKFDYLVSSLEPPLDSEPIKDQSILSKWYDLWEPLEIKNATNLDKGIKTELDEVKNQIIIMKGFLSSNLEKIKNL